MKNLYLMAAMLWLAPQAAGVQDSLGNKSGGLSTEHRVQLFHSGPVARTESVADDASLNDVCAVGKHCWAVGERGVLVRSTDGGLTWETKLLPTECSLQSVSFLTDKIGFVAGSGFDQASRLHRSVLMTTRDGGDSWAAVSQGEPDGLSSVGTVVGAVAAADLPPLTFVRFFDLEHGVAVGVHAVEQAGATVFRSQDGGVTWVPLTSDAKDTRWRTGDFLSPHEGVIAGGGNASGAVVGDKVVTLQRPRRSLSATRDVSLFADGTGWMAGDGALLLKSDDRGITWRPPAGGLSAELNTLLDCRTIDHTGKAVCVAGSPGSIVLHSSDAGQSWTFRQLSGSAPIHRLRFAGPTTVIAVGAFGVIHRSTDAGLTWSAVRNGTYRAAVLCLATNPHNTSMRMLADISGDQGFRSVVVQPSARLPRDGVDDELAAERLRVAVSMAGANAFEQDWMFSRDQPLQHRVRAELLRTWARQTDGRVSEILPRRLAEYIRVWRPDVICVEADSKDDGVAGICLQALENAMQIAAEEEGQGKVPNALGLAPWSVSRVVVRQPDGTHSPLQFRGDDILSHCGTSTDLVADFCAACAAITPTARSAPPARGISDAYLSYEHGTPAATPAHLLAGRVVAPGSASRRMLSLTTGQQELMETVSRKNRTQRAALEGLLNTTTAPLQLIASLKSVGKGLPDQLALQQLQFLAGLYASLENLDGQIAVLNEIVSRFPDSAASVDAAAQLFQFYSSAELRFLRQKNGSLNSADQGSRVRQIASTIPALRTTGTQQFRSSGNALPAGGVALAADVQAGQGKLFPNSVGSDVAAVDATWDRNAAAALRLLSQLAPDRALAPEILLREAANARRADMRGRSQTLLSRAAAGDGQFSLFAAAELQTGHGAQTSPLPVRNLSPAVSRPFLDGSMTEECWQNAVEIHLAPTDNTNGRDAPDSLIMLSWDKDYIYISGRMEFATEHRGTLDRTVPRHHDAAHGLRDRIEFVFDTDRDYTTGFHFSVDETGQTSERCWTARSWDPQWFLAEGRDEQTWRFEAAIPQAELGLLPVRAGDLWAISIRRIVPGVLEQSFGKDEDSETDAATNGFGLLRFIRNRK